MPNQSTAPRPVEPAKKSRAGVLSIIGLLIASVVLVLVQVPQNTQISLFDEYVYADYLAKVPTEGVLRHGEETGDFARNELACRGVVAFGEYGEGCNVGRTSNDAAFPYNGGQGADIYTPLYFASTWVVAQPLVAVGVNLLDAGRLVGALWLALGVLFLYLAMREVGAPRALAVGLNLLIIASPATYWAMTYLSTDAPTLASAAILIYLALRIRRRSLNPLWLILASVVSVLFKVQNIGAVGIITLWLVLDRLIDLRHTTGQWRTAFARLFRDFIALSAAGAAVAAVLAQLVWMRIRAAIALSEVEPAAGDLPLTPTALVDEAFKFIFSVGEAGHPAGSPEAIAAGLLGLLTIAGCVALIVSADHKTSHLATFALSTLVICLMFGPLLAISATVSAGYYFPLPPRYGLVLLPALALCAAAFLGRYKYPARVIGVVGAGLYAVALLT